MNQLIDLINKQDTVNLSLQLTPIITTLINDNQINARNQLITLTDTLKQSTLLPSFLIILYPQLLTLLSTRSLQFEQSITTIREFLATLYEESHDYILAAQCLQLIPLESTARQIPLLYKMQINNWIVRLYLEEEDAVSAETYLNRMANGIHECNDKILNLQFKFVFFL